MASNVTVQSVLGKISQDHLECSICSCRFKEPKVLDCLHSFCLKCLQELSQCQEPDSTKLTCPLCRCHTTLIENNVTALPNNFTLGAMVEEFTMQEQLLEGQGSEIKCQNCEEGNEAVSRCMNCDNFLCLECEKAHRRMAVLKTHNVNSMARLRSGEISYKSKLREEIPKCGKHPDQSLSIYCNTCEQLACTTCSVLDHASHSLSGPIEALSKCRQEIAQETAKAQQKRMELCTATREVQMIRKKLDCMFKETNGKIKQNVCQGHTKMTEEGKRLKHEAEKIYRDRVMTLDAALATNSKKASDTKKKLDELKQLIDQANCHEMLEFKQKVLYNLRELTRKLPQKVHDNLSFMDYQDGEISVAMGKLLLEGNQNQYRRYMYIGTCYQKPEWNKNREIHEYGKSKTAFQSASHLAVFSDNEVVIRDPGCGHLISISFKTPQSPPVSNELEIKYLYNPKCKAVNKDDELIVLAGTVVKTFNRQYDFLSIFKPCNNENVNGKPTCLAVDNSNLIAIGYEETNEISLHRPDGTLIKILLAPGIGEYLTICKEHLIYTDSFRLSSIDYDGRNMFFTTLKTKIGLEQVWFTGVCCDRNGTIYVTGTCWFSNGKVHHFGPDGQWNRCAIKACKEDVNDIILMPNGDLVIAAGDAVVVTNVSEQCTISGQELLADWTRYKVNRECILV